MTRIPASPTPTQPHSKPSMGDKVAGKLEVLVGKATHNTRKIIRGTAKETGHYATSSSSPPGPSSSRSPHPTSSTSPQPTSASSTSQSGSSSPRPLEDHPPRSRSPSHSPSHSPSPSPSSASRPSTPILGSTSSRLTSEPTGYDGTGDSATLDAHSPPPGMAGSLHREPGLTEYKDTNCEAFECANGLVKGRSELAYQDGDGAGARR